MMLTRKRWEHADIAMLARAGIGLLAAAVCFAGCDLPDRHDIEMFRKPATWEIKNPAAVERTASSPPSSPASSLGQTQLPRPSFQDRWQYWYLHHIDPDHFLGGGEMRSERISGDGWNDEKIQVMLIERTLVPSYPLGETLSQVPQWQPNYFTCLNINTQTFWHGIDGRLAKAECRVRRGPLETNSFVDIDENQVRIEVDHLTSQEKKSFPHQGDLGGPLAVYQSLLGNPLAVRQSRELTVLLPIQETLARLQIQGRRDALVKRFSDEGFVLDSLHEAVALVSIDSSSRRECYYWYDEDGVVQTSNITGEKRFTYRCSEQQYASLGEGFLSHTHPVEVELPGKPIPPGKIKQLALDIELSPGMSAEQEQSASVAESSRPRMRAAPRQYIQEIDATRQRMITAETPVPAKKLAGRFVSYAAESGPADTAATSIVNFGAPAVASLLQAAPALNGLSRRELAVEFGVIVHSLLSFEPLSIGIRPASLIAESSIADSTEHAILLIAMLRARGIPARLALGIRHLPDAREVATDASDGTNRFVYHAWVVARCDDEWISLDPTTGDETGADCVALLSDDLSELNASDFVDDYLAVLRSMRLTVSAVVMK